MHETVLRTTGRNRRCGSAGRGNRFGTTDQAGRAQQLQDLPGFPRAVQEGHGACGRGDQRVGRAPRTIAGEAASGSGIEFVEIAVPLGKIDAGPVVQAMIDSKPDAIFSSLFAGDLSKFVREGELRGLFKDRPVFNLLGGEPEYLDQLKEEAPSGWYVTGYPWSAISTPEHRRFLDAYQAKYKDYPRQGSVVGYSVVMSAAAAIGKARSTDTAKLVAALEGLNVDTPFGKITYRALDHQSTMGAYVGRIAVKDGKGVMIDWRYADGASYLPAGDWVRAHRPAN